MKRAIFPGTFDPFTIGHFSVVKRSLTCMDEVVIGIGINDNKTTYFPIEQRLEMISMLYKNEPRVHIACYNCLTVDFAKQEQANFIVRGIRTVNDFEYEETIAEMNRRLGGLETILFFTEPEHACVSSSIVRELIKYNKDISDFVPLGMGL